MKIITNCTPLLGRLTGIGVYIKKVCERLKEKYPNYNYTYYFGYVSKTLEPGKVGKFLTTVKSILKKAPYGREVVKLLKERGGFGEYDIYFEPNFIPLKNITARGVVVTVHDFSFVKNPKWHPKNRIQYFEKYFWTEIKRADLVLTDSYYIRNEAEDLLGMNPKRIRNVQPGIEHDIFRIYDKVSLERNLPENFMLFVGSIEPRKNINGLLKAYSSLSRSLRKDLKLVLIGYDGWENAETTGFIKKIEEDVLILSNVTSNLELAYLYNKATVFVMPSLYEGFGFPPLEAMACGCPTVVSNVASLPEVCSDASYYVNPLDPESIAEGIIKVVSDEELKKSLVKKGLKRAKDFSWDKTAKEINGVFKEVLGL